MPELTVPFLIIIQMDWQIDEFTRLEMMIKKTQFPFYAKQVFRMLKVFRMPDYVFTTFLTV